MRGSLQEQEQEQQQQPLLLLLQQQQQMFIDSDLEGANSEEDNDEQDEAFLTKWIHQRQVFLHLHACMHAIVWCTYSAHIVISFVFSPSTLLNLLLLLLLLLQLQLQLQQGAGGRLSTAASEEFEEAASSAPTPRLSKEEVNKQKRYICVSVGVLFCSSTCCSFYIIHAYIC